MYLHGVSQFRKQTPSQVTARWAQLSLFSSCRNYHPEIREKPDCKSSYMGLMFLLLHLRHFSVACLHFAVLTSKHCLLSEPYTSEKLYLYHSSNRLQVFLPLFICSYCFCHLNFFTQLGLLECCPHLSKSKSPCYLFVFYAIFLNMILCITDIYKHFFSHTKFNFVFILLPSKAPCIVRKLVLNK